MAHAIVTGLTVSSAARTILELDPVERDAAIVRLRAIVAHRAFDTGAIATVSRAILAELDQALGVQPLNNARDIFRAMTREEYESISEPRDRNTGNVREWCHCGRAVIHDEIACGEHLRP